MQEIPKEQLHHYWCDVFKFFLYYYIEYGSVALDELDSVFFGPISNDINWPFIPIQELK